MSSVINQTDDRQGAGWVPPPASLTSLSTPRLRKPTGCLQLNQPQFMPKIVMFRGYCLRHDSSRSFLWTLSQTFSAQRAPPLNPSIAALYAKIFLGQLSATLTMDIAFSTIELKDDTIIVVLGASGDLAKKKTVRTPPGCDDSRRY